MSKKQGLSRLATVVCLALLPITFPGTVPSMATVPDPGDGKTVGLSLPHRMANASAVWDPVRSRVYIFGGVWGDIGYGDDHYSDEIYEFNPADETLKILPTKLPSGRINMAAVWASGKAYLIGGREKGSSGQPYGNLLSDILEFDPATSLPTTPLVGNLGLPRDRAAAVSDGSGNIHVFGGDTNAGDDAKDPAFQIGDFADGGKSDEILTYNVTTRGVITSPVRIPMSYDPSTPPTPHIGREGISAVWYPKGSNTCPTGCAYLVGGQVPFNPAVSGSSPRSGQIFVFIPRVTTDPTSTDEIKKINPWVHQGVHGAAVAIDDNEGLLIIGGCCNAHYSKNWVERLDPILARTDPYPYVDSIKENWNRLPWTQTVGRSEMAWAFTGTKVYVFGGYQNVWPYRSNVIWSYDRRSFDQTRANFYWAPWEDHSTNPATPRDGFWLDGVEILTSHLLENRTYTGANSMHGPIGSGHRMNTSTLQVPPQSTGNPNIDGKTFMFGGEDHQDRFAWVDRYDPETRQMVRMRSVLPVGVASMGAVWDDNRNVAYLFGGFDASRKLSDKILEYNPASDQPLTATNAGGASAVTDLATTNGFKFASGRAGQAAVWDGRDTPDCPGGCAYIFGGADWAAGYVTSSQILRFNRMNGLTLMKAKLPFPRSSMSAVWDPSLGVAYLFGGKLSNNTAFYDEIFMYNPMLDASSSSSIVSPALVNLSRNVAGGDTGVRLPPGSWGTSAIWDGAFAYVFGAATKAGKTTNANDQWAKFDPRMAIACSQSPISLCGTSAVTLVSQTVPLTFSRVGEAVTCDRGLVSMFGGRRYRTHGEGTGYITNYYLDDIIRYKMPADDATQVLQNILSMVPSVNVQGDPLNPNFDPVRAVKLEWQDLQCSTELVDANSIVYSLYKIVDGVRTAISSAVGQTQTVVDVACDSVDTFEVEAIKHKADGTTEKVGTATSTVATLALTTFPSTTAGKISSLITPARCKQALASVGGVRYRIYEVAAGIKKLVAEVDASLVTQKVELTGTLCRKTSYVVEAVRSSTALGSAGDGAEVLARSALSATTPMDVPRNLTSEAVPSIDRPSVKLAWGAPDPCERPQGYRIYRSAGTGAFTFLNEVPNGVLNYTDTAVATLPATYTYYVTALFSRGESLESNKSVVTTRSI